MIEATGQDVLSNAYINLNGRLGTLRHHILVVAYDKPPLTPAYADCGKWFYIPMNDVVSEKNFQLLTLFLTMMAIPPATQPLSPVINVGGS